MSVAEKSIVEHVPRNPQQQFAVSSAIGAVALLAGLGFIFAGLPMLWAILWDALWRRTLGIQQNNPFLADAILLLVSLAVVSALTYGAYRLLQTQKQPGLRAGIVALALYLVVTLAIGAWVGELMVKSFAENPTLGWGVLILIEAALWAGAVYVFAAVPGWLSFLVAVEDQGWFHATAYKGNQGVRVRRGTIMGILTVGITGIITMVNHHYFGSEPTSSEWYWILGSAQDPTWVPYGNDWSWVIPYSMSESQKMMSCVPIMFKVHFLMPIVLGVLLVWLGWRVVNVPAFADFLIATEAEMNKVSWTSRKRLVQDTIVVLTTVFLFTGFLFVVDLVWIKVLSLPGIEVLIINLKDEQKRQQETARW